MNFLWWRTHLRKLPELGPFQPLSQGDFNEADELMPFLMGTLDLPAGGRVVDLGCGLGSFSIRLAQWGYGVVGIEPSPVLLEAARQTASQHDVEVELRSAGLAELPERGAFDGALALDFGSQPEGENAALLRAVAMALRPGGRLVFSSANPYYWSRRPVTEHRTVHGMDVIRRTSFDFLAGCVVSRVRCIMANGERRALPEARFRAYTLPELRQLISTTGLADLAVYGEDESGVPRPERPLDTLRTPFFHCVALRPVTGEAGEGI